jgi:16S rRNA (guanine966-N2)-methyltransferase
MRIIGGQWRGRQIIAPAGSAVRPTGDRVREAWFSILQFDVPNATVLDLCAGSGALGIEALSRGATHVTFVDTSQPVLMAIQQNLESLKADAARYRLVRDDAVRFTRALPADAYDVAFADPPYASQVASELADLWTTTPFAAVLGIEHASDAMIGAGGESRRYGKTTIRFFRR